jgi:thiamine-monophosphate kinase
MKELEFIEIIKNTLSDSSFIGDDTAFVDGLAITQDTLIEDIHFRTSTITPYELGQKAIAVNLSDLAAAGAKPLYLLISLSLPSGIHDDFVEDFYKGVELLCSRYAIKVIGGDITGAHKISITVTAIGRAKKQIKRSLAKVGDVIFTTGEHGNSRAGFEILEKNLPENKKFINAHKTPTPAIETGLLISEVCEKPALMDTSDGLADALYKIAIASGVTLEVDFSKIPFDFAIKNFSKWQDWVLFGGEDYQLLGCVSKDEFKKLSAKVDVFEIGHVVAKKDFPVIIKMDGEDKPLDKTTMDGMSFDHFTGEQQ